MLSTSGELGTSPFHVGTIRDPIFQVRQLRDTGGKDSARHRIVTRGVAPRHLLYDQ